MTEENKKLDDCDVIIQEQLQEGVIEKAEMPTSQREFYFPLKPAVRESAETTKRQQIMYDFPRKFENGARMLSKMN